MMHISMMRAVSAEIGAPVSMLVHAVSLMWLAAVPPAARGGSRTAGAPMGWSSPEPLHQVDAAVLRDLGLERSQIGSVLNEGLAHRELCGLLREAAGR